MKCIFCSTLDTDVIETRPNEDGSIIRRRRECIECFKRFTTYERSERSPIVVIKKDGRREKFDREKLRRGLLIATGKTSVTLSQLEALINDVENELMTLDDAEVESSEVGELAAKRLRTLNKVAYIRFASVFRQFEEVEDFTREALQMRKIKV